MWGHVFGMISELCLGQYKINQITITNYHISKSVVSSIFGLIL